MSMVKIFSADSFQFDEPITQLVKLASSGLHGQDRRVFEKRAAAGLLQEVDGLRDKLASGDELIHLIAMGTTESYGSNRNGDGFRRAVLRERHPTFVKHAKFYRNHANKDPSKSYGYVVKSAFNEPMNRVELLVVLNGSDAAAKRNGGLVADKEMTKLAAGKEIPVSMACRVSHDICSYCSNKAPRVSDYCSGTHEGGFCKAGGLRNNIGALVEVDGGVHQLHADNPDPDFFDISNVFRGADRIAAVTGVLEKAASSRLVIKSAELASSLHVSIPYDLLGVEVQPHIVQRMTKLAYQLAAAETTLEEHGLPEFTKYAASLSPEIQAVHTALELPPFFREKFALGLRALADHKICLPLPRFIEIVAECNMEKAAEVASVVQPMLPGIYNRLLGEDIVARLSQNVYSPASATNHKFASWARGLAPELSLAKPHVDRRLLRATLRDIPTPVLQAQDNEKFACTGDAASRLTEEYALYKLAFLGAVPESEPDFALTAAMVLLQNYIS